MSDAEVLELLSDRRLSVFFGGMRLVMFAWAIFVVIEALRGCRAILERMRGNAG